MSYLARTIVSSFLVLIVPRQRHIAQFHRVVVVPKLKLESYGVDRRRRRRGRRQRKGEES